MTVAHLQSERDLLIISLRYFKFIFRNIKCLYADQVTTAKQTISRVIVIIILKKNIENIYVKLIRIELLNSMKTQSITIPEFRITFYLYPIGTLKSIVQESCKWIKIAYKNLTKKSSSINHFFQSLLYNTILLIHV